MDYYQQFSDGAQVRVKPLIKKRDELAQVVKAARKNLSREQEQTLNLQNRIAKLKSLSSISLTDDVNSFEKFKTSLKKLNSELETSAEIVQTFGEIIPAKQSELDAVSTNIKILLGNYLLESRTTADKEIQLILDTAMAERENFIAAFRKIYADAGEVFVANNEQCLPGPWLAREILEPTPPIPEAPKSENPPLIPPLQTSCEAVQ